MEIPTTLRGQKSIAAFVARTMALPCMPRRSYKELACKICHTAGEHGLATANALLQALASSGRNTTRLLSAMFMKCPEKLGAITAYKLKLIKATGKVAFTPKTERELEATISRILDWIGRENLRSDSDEADMRKAAAVAACQQVSNDLWIALADRLRTIERNVGIGSDELVWHALRERPEYRAFRKLKTAQIADESLQMMQNAARSVGDGGVSQHLQ